MWSRPGDGGRVWTYGTLWPPAVGSPAVPAKALGSVPKGVQQLPPSYDTSKFWRMVPLRTWGQVLISSLQLCDFASGRGGSVEAPWDTDRDQQSFLPRCNSELRVVASLRSAWRGRQRRSWPCSSPPKPSPCQPAPRQRADVSLLTQFEVGI